MDNQEWMPRIDRKLCIGCRDCIVCCPTGALGQRRGKAALVHPANCIYCTACEDVCPVNAIELPFLVCKVEGFNPNSQET